MASDAAILFVQHLSNYAWNVSAYLSSFIMSLDLYYLKKRRSAKSNLLTWVTPTRFPLKHNPQ